MMTWITCVCSAHRSSPWQNDLDRLAGHVCAGSFGRSVYPATGLSACNRSARRLHRTGSGLAFRSAVAVTHLSVAWTNHPNQSSTHLTLNVNFTHEPLIKDSTINDSGVFPFSCLSQPEQRSWCVLLRIRSVTLRLMRAVDFKDR